MMKNRLLSVTFMALLARGSALFEKFFHSVPKFRAVTFVSICLYKLGPVYAFVSNKFVHFMVCCVILASSRCFV